ncbi:MAG: hypothetical protein GY929_22220 [Actinomycetia bacterium]|nr:hypothetical protein [Actinomycetes bacterium]
MAITEKERLRLLDGFRRTLDEEQLATLSEVVHVMSYDNLATRQDLAAGLSELQGELKADIAEVRLDGARDLRIVVGTQLATTFVILGFLLRLA